MRGEYDDSALERLLAKRSSGLSIGQKEALFQAILRGTEAQGPARLSSGWRILVASTAVTAVAVVVALWPMGHRETAHEERFSARGSLVDKRTEISFECIDARGSHGHMCGLGSTLVFRTESLGKMRYLAAFVVGPRNTVWYFPSRGSGRSIPLDPLIGGFVGSGVQIGPEHQPGKHTLYIVLSREPLDRASVRAVATGSTEKTTTRIITSSFEVKSP